MDELPDQPLVPERYELTLFVLGDHFLGQLEFTFELEADVENIVLHARDLEFSTLSLRDDLGSGVIVAVGEPISEDLVRISAGRRLEAGRWTLFAQYRGPVRDDLCGLYDAGFEDADGRHPVYATQLEAVEARRVMPCIDEPYARAVFAPRLIVPKNWAALSNTEELSRRSHDDRHDRVVFDDSPALPPYLFAVVFGELEITEVGETTCSTPIRIAGRAGLAASGHYAGDVAGRTVSFLEDFFGIACPTPKLDLVALANFSIGGMENFGLVTFRESLIFIDPEVASFDETLRATEVLCHELVHQWFGGLTTMAEWRDLWLNEAFATFVSYLVMDSLFESYGAWWDFDRYRETALDTDALEGTRSVAPLGAIGPEDVDGLFDELTYGKGAALLRELYHYIGPDVFRRGVRAFLASHRFQCATTADLLEALGDASGDLEVVPMAEALVRDLHPPLISCSVVAGRLELVATPFRYQVGRYGASDDFGANDGREATGPVPVTISCDGVEFSLLCGTEPISLRDSGRRVIVNSHGVDYQRVRYDETLTERLLGAPDQLPAQTRAQLVSDSFALALAGRGEPDSGLRLLEQLGDREIDAQVWRSWLTIAEQIRVLSHGESHVATRLIAIARLAVSRLEESGDLVADTTRARWWELAGRCGDGDALEWAERVATGGVCDPETPVEASRLLAMNGDRSDWEATMWSLRQEADPQVRDRLVSALASFADPELVVSTLDAVADRRISAQYAWLVVCEQLSEPKTAGACWSWLVGEPSRLADCVPAFRVSDALSGVRRLADRHIIDDLSNRLGVLVPAESRAGVALHLERAATNLALAERWAHR